MVWSHHLRRIGCSELSRKNSQMRSTIDTGTTFLGLWSKSVTVLAIAPADVHLGRRDVVHAPVVADLQEPRGPTLQIGGEERTGRGQVALIGHQFDSSGFDRAFITPPPVE